MDERVVIAATPAKVAVKKDAVFIALAARSRWVISACATGLRRKAISRTPGKRMSPVK